MYTFGIFVIELTDAFEEGRGAVSLIPAILSGVTLGTGPIDSALVNYLGCRTVSFAGAILASVGLAISAIAPNVITLYFTVGLCTGMSVFCCVLKPALLCLMGTSIFGIRTFFDIAICICTFAHFPLSPYQGHAMNGSPQASHNAGFGFGLFLLPAVVSVSMYFEKKRALATGIAYCGAGLGTTFMAPLLHYLIDCYGWSITMVIMGAIVLLCAPLGALFKSVPSSNSAGNIEIQAKEKNSMTENAFGEDLKVQHCLPNGCSCRLFFVNILGKMMDVNLMGKGIFKMFALCSVLVSIGMYVPYVYTVVRKHSDR